jgi:hypothetical protein
MVVIDIYKDHPQRLFLVLAGVSPWVATVECSAFPEEIPLTGITLH